MKKRTPLRCAYNVYAVVTAGDGILCASSDGQEEVFMASRQAKDRISNIGGGGVKLSVAKCVLVPFEMWQDES